MSNLNECCCICLNNIDNTNLINCNTCINKVCNDYAFQKENYLMDYK